MWTFADHPGLKWNVFHFLNAFAPLATSKLPGPMGILHFLELTPQKKSIKALMLSKLLLISLLFTLRLVLSLGLLTMKEQLAIWLHQLPNWYMTNITKCLNFSSRWSSPGLNLTFWAKKKKKKETFHLNFNCLAPMFCSSHLQFCKSLPQSFCASFVTSSQGQVGAN